MRIAVYTVDEITDELIISRPFALRAYGFGNIESDFVVIIVYAVGSTAEYSTELDGIIRFHTSLVGHERNTAGESYQLAEANFQNDVLGDLFYGEHHFREPSLERGKIGSIHHVTVFVVISKRDIAARCVEFLVAVGELSVTVRVGSVERIKITDVLEAVTAVGSHRYLHGTSRGSHERVVAQARNGSVIDHVTHRAAGAGRRRAYRFHCKAYVKAVIGVRIYRLVLSYHFAVGAVSGIHGRLRTALRHHVLVCEALRGVIGYVSVRSAQIESRSASHVIHVYRVVAVRIGIGKYFAVTGKVGQRHAVGGGLRIDCFRSHFRIQTVEHFGGIVRNERTGIIFEFGMYFHRHAVQAEEYRAEYARALDNVFHHVPVGHKRDAVDAVLHVYPLPVYIFLETFEIVFICAVSGYIGGKPRARTVNVRRTRRFVVSEGNADIEFAFVCVTGDLGASIRSAFRSHEIIGDATVVFVLRYRIIYP